MPTYNRRQFIPHAIKYFQRQSYKNKELIIIDDGSDSIEDLVPHLPDIRYYRLERKITLGAKLNLACSYASGTIIVNWDDDDWYADWRLKYQVESLQHHGTGLCGINKLFYYDLRNKKAYHYIYPADQRVWLLGSSLCYTKDLWTKNRFADIDVGMDGLFVWNTLPQNITLLDDSSFSVHMIHNSNISPKQTEGSWWHQCPVEKIRDVMGADWTCYTANGSSSNAKIFEDLKTNQQWHGQTLSKNIYACLLHERGDCIKDLVRNLHYNDPSSIILLYNGSTDARLIPDGFSYEHYNTIVHPSPTPAKHGYLHQFALDSMQFALDNFKFDCLTFVDSDQLCIRKDYSKYLSDAVNGSFSKTGMLSSNPQRVDRYNKTNHVALQAFKEYDLWKPFLDNFEKGEDKFVHWTFWPSSVIMSHAARDLVELFKTNTQLQDIMKRTQIWASEEVILPTLVRMLGYDIGLNPCSYDLVRYKLPVNIDEIKRNIEKKNVFWIHPVVRVFEDPVRSWVRDWSNGYISLNENKQTKEVSQFKSPTANSTNRSALLADLNKIQGWLSTAEADLLLTITQQACMLNPAPQNIVEIGSYHGKATVLMGKMIKESFPEARIFSIDPHDGKLGATDQGLKTFPPSLPVLQRNIEEAGLTEFINIIQAYSHEVKWDAEISLLLIDGLHDYSNVSRDFNHFSHWLRPGGYVAFHDFADYYPGVVEFVKELLSTNNCHKVQHIDSLIILQKSKG